MLKGFPEHIVLAAVSDPSVEASAQAQAQYPECKIFSDADVMIRESDIDVAVITTPANDHARYAVSALKKKIHVFSDIPCVFNLQEADELWETAQKSSALYMTGANPNMWAFIRYAKEITAQGLIGKPYYAEAEYIHDIRDLFLKTPWRTQFPHIQYCTHSLGPVLDVINELPVRVSCFGTGDHFCPETRTHNAIAALFRTAGGTVIRVLVSFSNECPSGGHRYRIYGTEGYFERTPEYSGHGSAKTLLYSKKFRTDKAFTEVPVHEMREEFSGKNAAGHGGADYAMIDAMIKAVNGTDDYPIDLKKGLAMTIPGIYAAQSACNDGNPEDISYPWTS